mgnify:CR=1 FL=1
MRRVLPKAVQICYDYSATMQKTLPKWFILVFLAVAVIGLADATYLAASHYLEKPVVCGFLEGCDIVLESPYSTAFGLPVALWGLFYYLLILILAEIYLLKKDIFWIKAAAILSPFGFLASLWFVYLQLFVIKAVCLYCMVSATASAVLFILALYIFFGPNKSARAEIKNAQQG